MDVQATTQTLPSPAPISYSPPSGGADAAPPTVAVGTLPAAPDVSSGSGAGVAGDPKPGLSLLPPSGGSGAGSGSDAGSGSGSSGSHTLPGNVGKLYNAPPDSTSVSFQQAAGSNEVVTVVTDTRTGKVVVQFPSETLIALAQFFQKLDNSAANSGAVVDKKV